MSSEFRALVNILSTRNERACGLLDATHAITVALRASIDDRILAGQMARADRDHHRTRAAPCRCSIHLAPIGVARLISACCSSGEPDRSRLKVRAIALTSPRDPGREHLVEIRCSCLSTASIAPSSSWRWAFSGNLSKKPSCSTLRFKLADRLSLAGEGVAERRLRRLPRPSGPCPGTGCRAG